MTGYSFSLEALGGGLQQASHPRRASMPRPCRPAAAPRSRARVTDRTTAQARAPRAPRPNPAHAAPRPDDGRLLKPTHRVARVSTLEHAGRAPHYPSIRAVAVQPSSRSPRGLARCPHALHPLWQARMEPFLARSGGSDSARANAIGSTLFQNGFLPSSGLRNRPHPPPRPERPQLPVSPPLARPGHGPPRAARAPAPSCGAA